MAEDDEQQGISLDEIPSLVERCRAAGTSHRTEHFFESEDDSEGHLVYVEIPAGRETRELTLEEPDEVDDLCSIRFENYKFLPGFYAIWSAELGLIEAHLVAGTRVPASPRFLRRRVFRAMREDAEDGPVVLESDSFPGVKLSIGPPSREFTVLHRLRGDRLGPVGDASGWMTLGIHGIEAKTNKGAIDSLQRLGDSIGFQLDLALSAPMYPARERAQRTIRSRRTRRPQAKRVHFPEFQYDQQPMELYWYASGARGMPLLEFLAYYQVIEYYFAVYFHNEARSVVRNILKDPSFDSQSDLDVTRIISALGEHGGYRALGAERAQLLATISECVSASELRTFMEADETTKEFWTKSKSVSRFRIPINNPEKDLRQEVTDRLYDIRCRIVHSKSEESRIQVEPLLPFSRESQQLGPDIDLVRFVARKVLIASGTPLTI